MLSVIGAEINEETRQHGIVQLYTRVIKLSIVLHKYLPSQIEEHLKVDVEDAQCTHITYITPQTVDLDCLMRGWQGDGWR
jgi:hypothetical protein